MGFNPPLCCTLVRFMRQVIPFAHRRSIAFYLPAYRSMMPPQGFTNLSITFILRQHNTYYLPFFQTQMIVFSAHFGYLLSLLYPKWCVYLLNLGVKFSWGGRYKGYQSIWEAG